MTSRREVLKGVLGLLTLPFAIKLSPNAETTVWRSPPLSYGEPVESNPGTRGVTPVGDLRAQSQRELSEWYSRSLNQAIFKALAS